MPRLPQNIFALILCLTFIACSRDNDKLPQSKDTSPGTAAVEISSAEKGCRRCHEISLDRNHELACSHCHNGDNTAKNKDPSHTGLIAKPAAPEQAEKVCGTCHHGIDETLKSTHFTARNMVNLVRRHFGSIKDLASASDIPSGNIPETALDLADDLLRRNCLSCHLTYSGDDYSAVSRGIGCTSCHLEYRNGAMVSHSFIRKPRDQACLSCHYGNRIGNDYYGRFEHDFKHEYRTPYQRDGSYPPRPFGVEQHRLSADIHQKAGMACIDCHSSEQLMGNSPGIKCAACHMWQKGDRVPGKNLEAGIKGLLLTTAHDNRKLTVPTASDDLHEKYRTLADCQVCHGQWSYNDRSIHLLRLDIDEYEDWEDLVVQSGSEVEVLLSNSLYGEESYHPSMTDKITGQRKNGIWLKGYDIRRWEEPMVMKDSTGRFRIVRPALDLVLSWVNNSGETVFDSIRGGSDVLLPYTPHTTGPAGAFYMLRLTDPEPDKTRQNDP